MKRNDPNDSRTYNYCYKITNILNNKIYIGVHRTDNINDNYMGSGKLIKRAISKYGIENFKKVIIKFFDTYKEALEYEKSIVTLQFIEEESTYNLKEGGFGGCRWSKQHLTKMSSNMKNKWEDNNFKNKMLNVLRSPNRCKKIGQRHKKWILENPDKHKTRMEKINLNPEKIKKTANTHRGSKRSSKACLNIKQGIQKSLLNETVKLRRSGKGGRYFYDILTGVSKRFFRLQDVPAGWKAGTGRRKNKN